MSSHQNQIPSTPKDFYNSISSYSTKKEAIEAALRYSYNSYDTNKKHIERIDKVIENIKHNKDLKPEYKQKMISDAIEGRKLLEDNNKQNVLNISLLKYDLEELN